MSQPKTDYSFVVRQTFDTETGLISNVITLDEVYQLLDVMNKQGERLHLENERLRKAGDAMSDALMCSGCSECEGMYDSHEKALEAWIAAKGVQS